MKRFFCMLLAAALLCAALPMPALAKVEKGFSDVKKKDWFAGAVYALTERGIVGGTSATTFSPGGILTRAQMMQLLAASEATPEELAECKQMQLFNDVPAGQWYTAAVNWCAQRKIAEGMGNDAFKPHSPVTRAQAAAFLVRFAEYSDKITLTESAEAAPFQDDREIPSWARENVYYCQRTRIYSGYNDGTFRPNRQLKRSEAASLLCGLLGIAPLSADELPDDPVPPKPSAAAFSRTVAGVSVTGVEFDPSGYTAQAVLANNRLFTDEPASSILQRTGASIAVNGTFFNAYTADRTTFGTVMNRGSLKKIDNSRAPYKPTFAIDADGNASIEFMTIRLSAALVRDGEELDRYDDLACNVDPGNSSARSVITREFGTKLTGTIARAAIVDETGTVTRVYKSAVNEVPIPEKGFVLFERQVRGVWEQYFEKCQVGDQIQLSTQYVGASKQNFSTLLSCGPTVVKNGKAYGNASTYVQEGFTETKVTMGANAKMAIGVKADGTVVIAHCSCTMASLSNVMLGLGCQNAMSLDGGASCALYLDGKTLVGAGRNMNTMLVFTK